MKKHAIKRKCKVCGKEFEVKDRRRVTCSSEHARHWATYKTKLQNRRIYCETHGIMLPPHYCKKYCLDKCEEVKKLRILEERFPGALPKRDHLVNKINER